MSQIVVDTDVASYIFNWHSMAKEYVNALHGSDLILSFMTIAELRMGAISARWGGRRRWVGNRQDGLILSTSRDFGCCHFAIGTRHPKPGLKDLRRLRLPSGTWTSADSGWLSRSGGGMKAARST